MSATVSAMSVRARLVALARQRGQQAELLMTRYAVERLLYRLSISAYRERFVLKGALLFNVWFEQMHRPTRDADFLGIGPAEAEQIDAMFREIAEVKVDDGVQFDSASVRVLDIRQQANYPGLRVTVMALLASARLKVQVDIGFGDVMTLPAPEVEYPGLLADIASPRLRMYPMQAVLAEKLHILVTLGIANSRLKDYFDLWTLSQQARFEFAATAEAVAATFARRSTPVPDALPVGLSDEFSADPAKQAQWRGFLKRTGLTAPPLAEVVVQLRSFLWPLLSQPPATPTPIEWHAGGPWQPGAMEIKQ